MDLKKGNDADSDFTQLKDDYVEGVDEFSKMAQPKAETVSEQKPALRASDWIKPVIPIALIALCAEMGTSVLNNSTLPVYFTEGLGLGKDVLANIVIPFYVAEALFKVPLGVLADKLGRKPLMLMGCLI